MAKLIKFIKETTTFEGLLFFLGLPVGIAELDASPVVLSSSKILQGAVSIPQYYSIILMLCGIITILVSLFNYFFVRYIYNQEKRKQIGLISCISVLALSILSFGLIFGLINQVYSLPSMN